MSYGALVPLEDCSMIEAWVGMFYWLPHKNWRATLGAVCTGALLMDLVWCKLYTSGKPSTHTAYFGLPDYSRPANPNEESCVFPQKVVGSDMVPQHRHFHCWVTLSTFSSKTKDTLLLHLSCRRWLMWDRKEGNHTTLMLNGFELTFGVLCFSHIFEQLFIAAYADVKMQGYYAKYTNCYYSLSTVNHWQHCYQ